MTQTAVRMADHVSPHVPLRQWVLSLPIPLRALLAAQPTLVTLVTLVTPVQQVVQQVLGRRLLEGVGLTRATAALGRGSVKER